MSTSVRAVIVEDEPVAMERLRRLLGEEDDLEIVGEAATGAEALRRLRAEDPDVVFLDIRLPDMNAFEVVREMGPEQMPLVVFVTAYEEHAVHAFEVNAVDYVLKPFDAERLSSAMHDVRVRLHLESAAQRARRLDSLLGLMEEEGFGLRTGPGSDDRLVVKSRGKIRFVDVDDVDWIEAAGNYVRLHLSDGETELVRETMTRLEERLDPDQFMRIHRSSIVNLGRVEEIRHWSSGEYVVELEDGTELKLTRTYRERILDRVLGSG
jgi:two-component system LytT family response regulator